MLRRLSPAWGLVGVSLCLIWLGALPLAAGAQADLKIGVMDVQKILTESERGKAILTALEALRTEKMSDLTARQNELNELQSRYTETRLSLSDEKLEQMEKDLEDKNIALQRAQDDAQRDLQKKQQEDFGKIEREVLPIISTIGKELGYTMIFNKYQSGLVFADDTVDITTLVIERFNAVAPQGD